MSLEDKHLQHLAALQAVTDNSWSSWNSPVGLTIGLLGIALFLNGLVFLGILVRYIFLMK